MALIEKLKDTVTGAVKVALSAGQQVQSTAVPAVKQTARAVRSQLEQRLSRPPGPVAPPSAAQPAPVVADTPAPPAAVVDGPAAPTPAEVAKNIAPQPAASAPKQTAAARTVPKSTRRSAPGAKLPVKRPVAPTDSA